MESRRISFRIHGDYTFESKSAVRGSRRGEGHHHVSKGRSKSVRGRRVISLTGCHHAYTSGRDELRGVHSHLYTYNIMNKLSNNIFFFYNCIVLYNLLAV